MPRFAGYCTLNLHKVTTKEVHLRNNKNYPYSTSNLTNRKMLLKTTRTGGNKLKKKNGKEERKELKNILWTSYKYHLLSLKKVNINSRKKKTLETSSIRGQRDD